MTDYLCFAITSVENIILSHGQIKVRLTKTGESVKETLEDENWYADQLSDTTHQFKDFIHLVAPRDKVMVMSENKSATGNLYGQDRNAYLKTLFWFLLANYILSLFINYSYIIMTPGAQSPLSKVFINVALLSNTALVYLVLAVFLSLGAIAPRRSTWILSIAVLIVTVLHMLNILDIIIFRIFKYHINSMVIVLVFTEGARDSLHIGYGTVVTYMAIVGSFIAFEVFLLRFCRNTLSPLPVTGRVVSLTLIFSLIFILADKATYAVSDLYNITEVTRCTKVFPLYQRVTIKRFMARNFGFDTGMAKSFSSSRRSATLSYPLEALSYTPVEKKPNFVCMIIDAWRFDMLNADVTPNILKFSNEAVVFNNHYSGGNASRFGVFTFIYGVPGKYWHPFLSEQQGPVLIDELIKQGYDFQILSSSKLTNPEFRKTAFVKLHPYINDTLPGTKADERDPELVKAFVKWLDHRNKSKPFYSFMFFDAPHGPYSYPDRFEKFRPSNKNPNYITTSRKDALALRNSYKNAIYFDDYLVGQALEAIRGKGLLEDTVIIITGDHGEEFYENGFWGHTSSFSQYQTRVPLVMYIPGRHPAELSALTSHLDVTPTILEMLGCKTPSYSYSQGQNLFTDGGHEYVTVSGWSDCAIIDKESTIVLPTETYNAGASEARTTHGYRLAPDEDAVFRQKQGTIISVMKQMSMFLK